MLDIVDSGMKIAVSGKPLDDIGWRTAISWFGDHALDWVAKCAKCEISKQGT